MIQQKSGEINTIGLWVVGEIEIEPTIKVFQKLTPAFTNLTLIN